MKYQLSRRLKHFLEQDVPVRGSQVGLGFAVGSLQGPLRDDNQDRAILASVVDRTGASAIIGVVCDGLGGMSSGGPAASIAAGILIAEIVSKLGSLNQRSLLEAVQAANFDVYRELRGDGGTTLTALICLGNGENWAIHVGDSRLYSISIENELKLLTRDDTVAGLAQNFDGDEDQLDNRLLQFVGIGEDLEPHVYEIKREQNKGFLLTSDGAHSLGRESLKKIVGSTALPADWVRRIIYVSDALNVTDNATALAICNDDFQNDKPFNEGTTIKVWTANDKLELWLEENIVGYNEISGQPSRSPSEDRAPEGAAQVETSIRSKNKPKANPGKKPKGKPRRRPPKKKIEDQTNSKVSAKNNGRPQLNIKFDSESGGNDDSAT